MPFAPPRNRLITAAWIALLALVTWFAFEPVLAAGFVNWDDGANILENEKFRGFSGEQLRWMFTTTHLGPYQPLSWLSLALDYVVGGLDAGVYHRTNIVLHVAGAIALFFLARRVFEITAGASFGARAIEALAFATALLFAVHPLRCESVCWVTERRDVISGPFFFASLYFWLGYARAPRGSGTRDYVLALACLVLSLLGKASAMVMPALLVLVDLWPLCEAARARGMKRLVLEKLPVLALSIVFMIVAWAGQSQNAAMVSGEAYGLFSRAIQAGYAALWYVARMLWPADLMPIHELPPLARFHEAELIVPALVTVAATLAAGLFFRRAPALATCWFAFLVILAPVSGLVQSGPQLVAERYSYLACAPFALLAAAGFARLALRWKSVAIVGFVLVAGLLFVKTREQCGIWLDSERLWNHTLAIDPTNGVALGNLAVLELEQGQNAKDPRRAHELLVRSSEHGERAVLVRPEPRWLFNLAAAHYQLAQREPAQRAEHITAAVNRSRQGREAALALKRPVEPRWSVIHALALYEANLYAEALPIAQEARAGSPGDAEVARLVANLLLEVGRIKEAVSLLEEGLRASPDNSLLWYDLSRTLERGGDAKRAAEAARSGRKAAEKTLGARASELPWYAELVRRGGP